MSTLSADEDVLAFLEELGLEHLAPTLTENGFYTSLAALSAATFDELLDCNLKPVPDALCLGANGARRELVHCVWPCMFPQVHAKLIMSALKSKGPVEKEPEKLAAFLRSVG